MVKVGFFEEMIEQGGTLVKQMGKQAVQVPSDLAKAAKSQVAPITTPQSGIAGQGPVPAAGAEVAVDGKNAGDAKAKKDTQDIVKSLYGIQDGKKELSKEEQKRQEELLAKHKAKSPEEIQQIQKLKQELHQTTYYQPLVTPPKQPEEKPVEKIEREKKEEEFELQKKEKEKPTPLAVQRGRESAEKHPGASG